MGYNRLCTLRISSKRVKQMSKSSLTKNLDYSKVSLLIDEHVDVAKQLEHLKAEITQAALIIGTALNNGGKVLLCGNGGSAADAQHIAADFVGRFIKERRPLPALALHVNTSSLTAIGNDYSYDQVFAREVLAHGRAEDVLVAISTSGN